MDMDNIIIQYVKRVEEVPLIGHMTAKVTIHDKPYYGDEKSMRLDYYVEMSCGPLSLGDPRTLSYSSTKAEDYRQRMSVEVIVPGNCSDSAQLKEARKATVKLLPQIIAEHERMMATRQ